MGQATMSLNRQALRSHVFLLALSFAAIIVQLSHAQLSDDFYASSCPNVANIIRGVLTGDLVRDPTAPAAFLRLLFHDCQVQGCDGSILLVSQGGIVSELESPLNLGVRRLEFLYSMKTAVESACPGTVSCADIVVLAAREAVNMAGGPSIQILLGRRDGTSASSARATAELPAVDISFNEFVQLFASKGMSMEESVAMLGAHTLGVGHCANIVNRLYPQRDPTIGPLFYSVLRLQCPPRYSQRAVFPNDLTPLAFDNQYYSNALSNRGLFSVDSEMATNSETSSIMQRFAQNPSDFFQIFSSAFDKLSRTGVLTGSEGEIRQDCRFVN